MIIQKPVGRFAPSPTGFLHFGSLLTAIASYCHVKSQAGSWFIRIEDTDIQRCKTEYSDSILRTLAAFGLYSDTTIMYQRKRQQIYADMLEHLLTSHAAYACECSRKSIQYYIQDNKLDSQLYPNICRDKKLIDNANHPLNIRQCTQDQTVIFDDMVQGKQQLNPKNLTGDMVLRRREGIYNYLLTSVVDDAEQGITEIIRGLDLLELTPCQLQLYDALASNTVPHYGHLPLAHNTQGQKLSKQNKAKAVCTENEATIINTFIAILNALQQPNVEKDIPSNMLKQAVAQWRIEPLKNKTVVKGVFS